MCHGNCIDIVFDFNADVASNGSSAILQYPQIECIIREMYAHHSFAILSCCNEDNAHIWYPRSRGLCNDLTTVKSCRRDTTTHCDVALYRNCLLQFGPYIFCSTDLIMDSIHILLQGICVYNNPNNTFSGSMLKN